MESEKPRFLLGNFKLFPSLLCLLGLPLPPGLSQLSVSNVEQGCLHFHHKTLGTQGIRLFTEDGPRDVMKDVQVRVTA